MSGWTPDHTTHPRTGRGFCKYNKPKRGSLIFWIQEFLNTVGLRLRQLSQHHSYHFVNLSNSLIKAKFRRDSCINKSVFKN